MLGILGGTGLEALDGLRIVRREVVRTPWGEPSGPLVHGRLGASEVVFLARHGPAHSIAPHRVNYRANVWALREVGVDEVVALAAVGGIHPDIAPGRLAVPDQIVDYTWSRAASYYDAPDAGVVHVDFTEPYAPALRARLLAAAASAGVDAFAGGTYAATQGPRLESAAEIRRRARDGSDMVGMTGMPEAGLARAAGLAYAHG